MSGSITVGSSGATSGLLGTTIDGPFEPFTKLRATALNAALLYGNKLGGALDNCPIGQSTPNVGSFTTLTASTVGIGDNSINVATTAWVNQRLGSGGGGGGSISVDSPAFTGNPTAPTQPFGSNNLTLANTAFVQAAFSNNTTATTYGGSGAAGWLRDNGSGTPSAVSDFTWGTFFVSNPSSNWVVPFNVPFNCNMTGLLCWSPNASGSDNFTLTITKNGSAVGSTYTGTSSSSSVTAFGSSIAFAKGDLVRFIIGTMSGTPPSATWCPTITIS